MSINHFSRDLPEAIWWSQSQQPQMETNQAAQKATADPSWPSFHWLKQPHPLHPPAHNPPAVNLNLAPQNDAEPRKDPELNPADKEPMFEKPLTPSDVGKLNRLVIPKQHAEKYFPLGSDSVEKGLLLSFEDELGKCWQFRYSYWNSSQSYVLTKGWSRYVKEKRLDAGDVVAFERHRIEGERLFIGWRRRGDNSNSSVNSSGGAAVQGSNGGGWSRGGLPYHHHQPHGANVTARVPFQLECLHAGGVEKQTTGNSKRLRLFGVNMECQLDEPEPSTPDGSSTVSSQGQHFYASNSIYDASSSTTHPHMDISLSRDVNQMRNRREDKICGCDVFGFDLIEFYPPPQPPSCKGNGGKHVDAEKKMEEMGWAVGP